MFRSVFRLAARSAQSWLNGPRSVEFPEYVLMMPVMRCYWGALGGVEPGTSSEKPREKSATFIWTFRAARESRAARDTGTRRSRYASRAATEFTRRSRYEILRFPSIGAVQNEVCRCSPSLCFPIKNAYSAIPRWRSAPGTGLSGIGARIL